MATVLQYNGVSGPVDIRVKYKHTRGKGGPDVKHTGAPVDHGFGNDPKGLYRRVNPKGRSKLVKP